MNAAPKVEKILTQISKLDYESRLYLMEKLVRQMQEDETKQASVDCHLTDLEMLGSEIWKDVNIDEFVQEERQWD